MSELLKPPTVPLAILKFFKQQPDFPALAGDISEEFQQRARSSGATSAKSWYWREAIRNAFALTWREIRRTPVRTALVALSCIVAVHLLVRILYLVTYGYQLTPVQPLSGPDALGLFLQVNFMPSVAMGSIGGRLLPGREWALALTFTVISECLVYFSFTTHYAGHLLIAEFSPSRQGIFWLGCLLIRQTRLPLTGASQHV